MRTAPAALSLVSMLALAGAACHRAPGGLHVVSHTPSGSSGAVTRIVSVTFDKPMAGAVVGKDAPPSSLVLQPAVAGRRWWSDRQTLTFRSEQPLPRSNEFRVVVDGRQRAEDGSHLGDDYEFSFTTERLEVTDLTPPAGARKLLPPDATLTLAFSQPVRGGDVVDRCLLDGGNGRVSLALVDGDKQLAARAIAVHPDKALEHDHAYALVCDAALHGAEGSLGLAAAYRAELHTYGDFAIAKSKPEGLDADVDGAELIIEFTTPTTVEEVRRTLVAEPAIAGLTEGALDSAEHRTYRAVVSLSPGERYSVRIGAATKDIFGQTLKGRQDFAFTAGDAKPRLALKSGVTTVEAQRPLLGLYTRNLPGFDVDAARVPVERLVPLLVANQNAEYDADRLQSWHQLGVKTRHLHVKVEAPKNRWQPGTLGLAAITGGGDVHGVFAVAAKATSALTALDLGIDSNSDRAHYVLANVTNLGLVAKLGATSGLVWAVHLDDGKPAPGVQITLRDSDNKVRFTGTTSDDGTVTTPGRAALLPAPVAKKNAVLRDEEYGEENEGGSRAGSIYVLGKEGADLAFIGGAWEDDIQTWQFDLGQTHAPADRLRGFIHTDRGLYRPGELVHVKGLVRAVVAGQGLRVPKEKQALLVISDPHGDGQLRKSVPISAFGGFSVDLPLSAEARLGDWNVAASVGEGAEQVRFADHFSVEEYRPVSFEVALKPARPAYELGQRPKIDLKAAYLYGAPLSHGHVAFSVRRRDHVPSFAAFSGWSFADLNALEDNGQWWARYGERSYSELVTESEAELDGNGAATLRFATSDPQHELHTAQDYLVEANVSDDSHQTITKSVLVVAHRSPFYLGLHAKEFMPAVGKPFTIEAIAVDDDGKPRAAEATLVVSHRAWECGWEATAGSAGGYTCKRTEAELERRKVTLGATATPLAITVARSGQTLVSLRAPDGRGNEVVASDYVYALGGGDADWRESDDLRFPLVASQPRYRPGDQARLVAQANLKGAAMLVTVEREGVLSHEVRTFTSSGDAIVLPISEAHAPNIYVSVVLARGRTGDDDRHRPMIRMGLCNLEVDAAAKRLAVQVTTDKPSYRPGETVKARVQVRAGDGSGVPAEVSLAASDEGVLQLIGFKTPDPQAAFYAALGLAVGSSSNWMRLHRDNVPGADEDGEGGDGGDSSGHLRSKFLSTAFWAPALVTGADGAAEVSFSAPDNLTAFRVMAVAADAGDRFGSGEVRMTVAKPLSAQPALPRFFTVGDEARAGVLVHNNSGHAGQVTVTAEAADGVSITGERKVAIAVPANGAVPALFALRAGHVGSAKLTFHATLGDEKDAVQVSIPVEQPSGMDVELLGEGELGAAKALTLAMARPKDALPDVGGLEVTVDSSGLAGLDEGLRYLIEYPYGCLEQTTSRLIPMVKVDDLARSLALPGLRGGELRGFVNAGIAKILRHQHDDGAFSLWPTSSTEPFLTAFALYGLTQAKHAGYAVDKKAIERGLRALADSINKSDMGQSDNPLGEAGSRAFALFVLADLGKPDAGAMAKLFQQRAELPLFGEAFLARALERAGGDAISVDVLVADVVAHTAASGDGKRIVDRDAEKLRWYFSSDTRTSAVALSMLLEVAPEHALVAPLTRGLLAARTGGRWDNTQDNLFALVALADAARAKLARGGGAQRVVVTLGDKTLLEAAFTKGKLVQRVRVPIGQLGDGKLTIAPVGGPVYYSARIRYARTLSSVAAAEHGFAIERRFEDPETKTPLTTLTTGQLVRVTLTVRAPDERQRVALVDHLPAGLEPVNPRLGGGDDSNVDRDRGRDNYESRWVAMEQHDDRVALFADNMWRGVLEFSYLARATTAGKFLLPAATVEEMYRPAMSGHTAGGVLEVRAK
jgi:uncharacterized protein YfaS (alpha-2-macroglobulin family)